MIINATSGGGLKRLIKNDDSVTVTVSGNNNNYFDTTYGIKVAYCKNGDVILCAKTGSFNYGANINFTLGSVPTGVAITYSGKSTTKNTISCCILSGITTSATLTATATVSGSGWGAATVNISMTLT